MGKGITHAVRRSWVIWPFIAAAVLVAFQARTTSASAPGQWILPEEQTVVDLVNVERKKAGKKPLIVNYSLQDAAWAHNEHMVASKCFNHVGCGDGDPGSRVKKTGYQAETTGENIAQGQKTPQIVVNGEPCSADNQAFCMHPCSAGFCNGWMQSPPHRANILRADFTDIGVAYTPAGDPFGPTWTQVFAAPQSDYRTVTPPRNNGPTATPRPCGVKEDVNGDRIVNRLDVDAVSGAFLATPASPKWNARYDIVANGVIDLYDVFGVVKAMGTTCP